MGSDSFFRGYLHVSVRWFRPEGAKTYNFHLIAVPVSVFGKN